MSPLDQFFISIGVQGFWALILVVPVILATLLSLVFTLRGRSRIGWIASLSLLAVFLILMEGYVYTGYLYCRATPCEVGNTACHEAVAACGEWLGPGFIIFAAITLVDLLGFLILRSTLLWLRQQRTRRRSG